MPKFTQGICGDGAAILCDGEPVTPEQIVEALNALDFLVTLKYIKDDLNNVSTGTGKVMKQFYKDNKSTAWHKARQALGL